MSATLHFLHDQSWADARGIDNALRQIAAETPLDINKDWRQFMTDCANNEPVNPRVAAMLATVDLTPEAPMVTDATADDPEGLGAWSVIVFAFALIGLFCVAFFAGKAILSVALTLGGL